MTHRDIQKAPIRWKVPGAGFVGAGGFVALVDRDPDPFPCVVFDGPEDEREGDTLEEARQALAERRFLGAAYHLSDCQLLEDRPPEHAD